MGIDDVAADASSTELEALAQDISNNVISGDCEERLVELLAGSLMEERQTFT